jgi:hypothetical protein
MATMAATKDFTRSPLVDSSERKEQRRYIIQNAPITDEEIQEECNMVRYEYSSLNNSHRRLNLPAIPA